MTKLSSTFKAGLIYCVLLAAGTYVFALRDICVDWPSYLNSVHNFERGLNPYGRMIEGRELPSQWIYSLSAMPVFWPSAHLPHPWGYLFYGAVCWSVFFFGLTRFLRFFFGPKFTGLGFFFLILSCDISGAARVGKLEVLCIGILFVAFSWVLEGRNRRMAAALFGWILGWKFQLLPVFGLLSVVAVFRGGSAVRRFLGETLLFTATFFLIPWILLPFDRVLEMHSLWLKNIPLFLEIQWKGSDHVYEFARLALAWDITYADSGRVNIAVAVFLAGALAFFSRQVVLRTEWLILTALGWGTAFSVLFSPVSQAPAYILATPLLVAAYCFRHELRSGIARNIGTLLLWLFWFFDGLIFSDVVPPQVRTWARTYNVHPLGYALLLVASLVWLGLFLRIQRAPHGTSVQKLDWARA